MFSEENLVPISIWRIVVIKDKMKMAGVQPVWAEAFIVDEIFFSKEEALVYIEEQSKKKFTFFDRESSRWHSRIILREDKVWELP